jgi:hypothetical protein
VATRLRARRDITLSTPSTLDHHSTNIAAMDRESVYTRSIGLQSVDRGDDHEDRTHIQKQLIDFIIEFRVDNRFVYRYAAADSLWPSLSHLQRPDSRKCTCRQIHLRYRRRASDFVQ